MTGPDAYVSPSWYPAKAEHGKVVPAWNYSAVHLSGTARVHDDPQSQNRSDADPEGVIDGLRADGRPGDLRVASAQTDARAICVWPRQLTQPRVTSLFLNLR